MYGRHVRDPLTIIREGWEEPKAGELKESAVSYLLMTILIKLSDKLSNQILKVRETEGML